MASPASRALNPAFDITPAALVTAIVTERRLLHTPAQNPPEPPETPLCPTPIKEHVVTGSNRRIALAAAALVASAALAACSQGSTSAAPGGGGGGGDQTATKKASDIVVGYAGPTLTNAFFVGLEKGVKDGAKANGFQLKETNANGDAAQQFNDATNLLNQGVDVLVLTPIDSNGITPVVQAANQRTSRSSRWTVGPAVARSPASWRPTTRRPGEEAATWIAGQLNKRYGKAQGNVVDLVGLVGTTAAADRETGFQTGLKANPGLKLWPSRREASTRRSRST